MESILESMSNETFTGKIDFAVKTSPFGDSFPVFGDIDVLDHRRPYYDDDSTWYRKEVITVDKMLRPDQLSPYDNSSTEFNLSRELEHDLNGVIKDYRKEFEVMGLDTNPDRIKLHTLDGFHQFQSSSLKQLSPKDKAHNEASQLLSKCLFRKNMTREDAEHVIKLVEEHSLGNFDNLIHGFVCFPDILDRFLQVQRKTGSLISEDDLASMIARCIEHSPSETYGLESLKYLLTFKGDLTVEIKLLPGKYNIDNELYELAKSHNVHDSYYDAYTSHGDVRLQTVINCESLVYVHSDVVTKEKSGKYTGFRDAYHALLYGDNEHLQALILRWDLWGDDCTADAAREFFKLNEECPLQPLMTRVNEYSSKRRSN